MWAASIFSGRTRAQQVSACSELSLTRARHSPCPPPPHSRLTQVESCPGNYPPTLRATGLEERDTQPQSPFPSDHGAAVAPVGFSVCSTRVDAPGLGGLDGGRQETATKFSSQKKPKPGSAPRRSICNQLRMVTSPGLRRCSAWDN